MSSDPLTSSLAAIGQPSVTQRWNRIAQFKHGEAFAFVKYLLFAHHARKSGNQELAALFEKTADTERFEHLAEEARLAGLVGCDADNLKDAIKGESYEIDKMYLQFAQSAEACRRGSCGRPV